MSNANTFETMDESEQEHNRSDRVSVVVTPRSQKPVRNVSGQFPCSCVIFDSLHQEELDRNREAKLRKRFESLITETPTRDIEEDESSHLCCLNLFGDSFVSRSDDQEATMQLVDDNTFLFCKRESSYLQVPLAERQEETAEKSETRPRTMLFDESCENSTPIQAGEEEEEEATMWSYLKKTARHDDDEPRYPFASSRREAHRGISFMNFRTSEARCEKIADLIKTQMLEIEAITQASPNDEVVPRCSQFNSQVIGGDHPHTTERSSRVRRAEDGDGVDTPNSPMELETPSPDEEVEFDDVAHQLQGEDNRRGLNFRREELWSHLDPRRFSQFENYNKNAESRKRRHLGKPPKFRSNRCFRFDDERLSHFLSERPLHQTEELEEGCNEYPGGSPQLKLGLSPLANHPEPRDKFRCESRKMYLDSYNYQLRSSFERQRQNDDLPRHTTNSELSSENTRTDEDEASCCALGNPNAQNSDVPEKDSNGKTSSDNFVRHLFGTDYDVTTRNYRRYNDGARDILDDDDDDIGDVVSSRTESEPKDTARVSSQGDDSLDDAYELTFQCLLDSLQRKIDMWKTFTETN